LTASTTTATMSPATSSGQRRGNNSLIVDRTAWRHVPPYLKVDERRGEILNTGRTAVGPVHGV
jgi:hypothetical protein